MMFEQISTKLGSLDCFPAKVGDCTCRSFSAEATHREVFRWLLAHCVSDCCGNSAGRHSKSINLGSKESPVAVRKDNIFDSIVDLESALDERAMPDSRRVLIAGENFIRLLGEATIQVEHGEKISLPLPLDIFRRDDLGLSVAVMVTADRVWSHPSQGGGSFIIVENGAVSALRWWA